MTSYKIKNDKASIYLNDDDLISEMITLIKPNPCLWNVAEPDYKNITKKAAIWNEIALKLNCYVANKNNVYELPNLISGKLVKAKFRNLKITYATLKNKRISEKDSTAIRWIHFQEIESLMTKIPVRTGFDSTLATTNEEANESNQQTSSSFVYETTSQKESIIPQMLSSFTQELTNETMSENEIFFNENQSTKRISKKRKHEEEYQDKISCDPLLLTFGKYIALSLNALPKEVQYQARHLIFNLLYKIESDPMNIDSISIFN
ncbi:uncharacterized protein LOC113788559 [Dermatophagoides pteronyssinus]|uniref:uncharacterized protein LOC113788559 n=1 Tax=Dermatophagoides pteronyssinus TaxID=6956 RepID=UPI003F67E3F7